MGYRTGILGGEVEMLVFVSFFFGLWFCLLDSFCFYLLIRGFVTTLFLKGSGVFGGCFFFDFLSFFMVFLRSLIFVGCFFSGASDS